MMSIVATVVIRRSDSWMRDGARAYKVLIDDVEVGRLKRGQEARFELEAREHTVQLRIDWKRSAEFALSGDSDEVFRFITGSTRSMTVMQSPSDVF